MERGCPEIGAAFLSLRRDLKPPNRADDGLRTRDLQLGKLALYQLSYVRVGGYFSMLGVALVT
jgi:hypothetical protein